MIKMNNLHRLLTLEIFGPIMEIKLVFIILEQAQHIQSTLSYYFSIIRDGKRGFFGIFKHKYKSVSRFYNQNFWDFYKMKLVD